MATATQETFRYEIELNDGRVCEIELDYEVTSQSEIEALVRQQLEQAPDPTASPGHPGPQEAASNVSLGDLGRQVLGGVRDAAQGILDTPTGILNTITEFISPDPPGPAGTRRRLVPEVKTPITLPNVPEGSTAEERGTRLLASLATALLELMQAALPNLLLLLRRFVMWMRDGDQIDTPEAVELLDALRWLEASVAE